MTQHNLKSLGWDEFFEEEFKQFSSLGFSAGRIAAENKNSYVVLSEKGELFGEVTGKLLFSSDNVSDLPKVGDWVVYSEYDDSKAVIHNVLKRRTGISRNIAGKKTDEQVIAANMDYVFIVQGLDGNFNLRRLERYLIIALQSGAEPVIILNKADLCENLKNYISNVKEIAPDIKIFAVSALKNEGIDKIKEFLNTGETAVFVGSSGVGKSTIINSILGEDKQETGEVREKDSRGRHVTSRREIILLPGGGLVIDTPGMRELQLWSSDSGFEETFADIEVLAAGCHFSDCSHTEEIKCAVKEALEKGELSEKRLESYRKLQKELRFLRIKQDEELQIQERHRLKELYKEYRRIKNDVYTKKGRI
ncbi:ribosome small subunit-dependent GTPase A [candidate division KSB1 bacterium]